MKLKYLCSLLWLLVAACGSESRALDPTSAPMATLGGYAAVSVDSPEVASAARFAVATIQSRSNSLEPYVLVNIASAKSQVVAGMNYDLKLILAHGVATEVHQVLVFQNLNGKKLQLTKDEITLVMNKLPN